ncbi:MAG: hypothetical protein SFV51_08810 [Bryobacteraceae bacterium]|nr:hypothetical protein [Bryobacteraceae bacterium]
MPGRVSLLLLCLAGVVPAAQPAPDPWHAALSALNLTPEMGVRILLPNQAHEMEPARLTEWLEQGGFVLLTGDSPAARFFGFRRLEGAATVRSVVDLRRPKLPIIWQEETETPVFEVPSEATLFAQEKRQGAALMAGLKRGRGGILWLATGPGANGFERYPYLPHALADLGLQPPVVARNLWAFFDSSYRLRADPNYLARKWRRNGVAAIHVAAWHYFETDEGRDKYLRELIGACHRNLIQVYAWLELPHVSERFWQDHPEWREKTASGEDAHLDWRKLMNLRQPACRAAVSAGVQELLTRFDWDGVNLAELYFESLEGYQNPSRFTPMNADVRREVQQAHGFDPMELFQGTANPDGLRQFLDYRAQLAKRIQQEWVAEIGALRRTLPHLDLVLTHVDNLLQPDTRDQIGADAKAILPMLDRQDLTLLVEDPAPAWSMGPMRYPELARRYAALTKRMSKVAIDINVVERYQDVYPTRQQTGVELFQEIHLAAGAFSRVTVYFESSILNEDWPLMPAALAVPSRLKWTGDRLQLTTPSGVGVRWAGSAKVNGVAWPVASDGIVWLPPGEHRLEAGEGAPAISLNDLNATLKSAAVRPGGLEFAYESRTRALAKLSAPPAKLWIDGQASEPIIWQFDDEWVLVLPRGQHLVTVADQSGL